jgi:hypothetical protein
MDTKTSVLVYSFLALVGLSVCAVFYKGIILQDFHVIEEKEEDTEEAMESSP